MLRDEKRPDLSVILPCLNEEKNIGRCIAEVSAFAKRRGLTAEVIVVDNGSTDRTARIAASRGAVVIPEKHRGYGRAIRTGLAHSRGNVIVIADGDSTYDLIHLEKFYFPLVSGRADVIIGNRFAGGTEEGAMPLLHRLGVPFLSELGRIRFGVKIRDFHCGLRSLTREAAQRLRLRTDGMEFATELIAEAKRAGLRIGQTPTGLRKPLRARSSKLRTFRDGLRHLSYIIFG